MGVPSTDTGPSDRGVSELLAVVTLVGLALLLVVGIGLSVVVLSPEDTGPPQANFSYQYLDQSSILLISHERGDNITAGNLFVEGVQGNASWTALASVNESIPVVPGDTVQIGQEGPFGAPIRSSTRIEVVWRNATVNDSAVLSQWSGDTGI